ncbi:MAG: hypothetical protein H0X37_04505 [Herpetosiphonaceae bacterium]|nr:hypothetical protein [Herpetosiphonaceae bacterium]
MLPFLVLLGLITGNGLSWCVARQSCINEQPIPLPRQARDWLPLVGALWSHNWFALTIELLTALTTVLLFVRHGSSTHFALLWLGALVLIDTGAVDWQVKLIDVLLLLSAAAVAVASAPWRALRWDRSLEGLATALVLFLLFFVMAKLLYPGQAAPFGLGDVYLGMFIGALVGFFDLPGPLFYGMTLAALASLAMIVTLGYQRARHMPISYGTYLCLGTLIYITVGPYR